MKFDTLRTGVAAAALSLLAAGAAAQNPAAGSAQGTGLNIPSNVTFVGRTDTGVRKATAIVNGEIITGSDVDQRLALIVASQRVTLPPEEVERVRAQVLRNLIDEALQIQAAAAEEITVTPAEIDQYFTRFSSRFQQTPQSFSAYLRSIGSSERSLKRQIQGEIAWQRLQRRRIEPFVNVGQDEVRAIIERLNASRGTSEYNVAEIFLSSTPETAAEVRANADRIIQQLRGGASFQAYARQFSEASTAAVGGNLGWIRAEQLPTELAATVQQMPVGSVSAPIEVPGGYSIVAVVDSRQILVADPRDAQLSLIQLSIPFAANTPPAQVQARASQLAEATRSMGGCGRAAETAARLGAESVSNDQVRVRDLPGPLQQMLLNLGVGEATPPFGSAERVSVLVMCGRDDPQQASGPNFDQVYAQLSEDRVNRRSQRYLRDLRRDAVIDYR